MDPLFRMEIDNHIDYIAFRRDLKPSNGYVDFINSEKNKTIITNEKKKDWNHLDLKKMK